MARKHLLILAGFVAVYCLGVFILSPSPLRPTISFVGYRTTPEGRRAIFKLENYSGNPYLFSGTTAVNPDYFYAIPSASAQTYSLGQPRLVRPITSQKLPPKGSIEFAVPLPEDQHLFLANMELPNPAPLAAGGGFRIAIWFGSGPSPLSESIPWQNPKYLIHHLWYKIVCVENSKGLASTDDWCKAYNPVVADRTAEARRNIILSAPATP